MITTTYLYLAIVLSPLVSSIITGLFGWILGKNLSHSLAILGVSISTIGAYVLLYEVQYMGLHFDGALYTWLAVGGQTFSVGLLVDKLSSVMLVVVTSVSLMVHVYTIGYMAHEEGYQRFFSYISLFTFMMLMLVLANNFIQLFFAWEGVGLVSYLLIGFYIKRQSAIFANLKAFLINRVGDLGFLLGIGLIFTNVGSLNYADVFSRLSEFIGTNLNGTSLSLITIICILLFIGAMGKSAQFPLHVWLPDSMEGPTPISALIHAATMVTAGIFMVARLSPIYNLSPTASCLMIYVGGINCLFLGILGIIQHDIKRIIAYSTLSQLGYMVVALGCGAYSVAIFHLMTHAFFKGLLFLAAGSVIIAMHHEQDIRKMGGLAKYMPITYTTMLIGSLALAGIPPFAGFFSKDVILESANAAYVAGVPGSWFAVVTVYTSVVVTAIYSFRLIFITFHGQENFRHISSHDSHLSLNEKTDSHVVGQPHESPWVVTLPLILMAIASVVVGWIGVNGFVTNEILSGSVINSYWITQFFNDGISPIKMIEEGFNKIAVYLSLLGILVAWVFYKKPKLSRLLVQSIYPVYFILQRNYFMDDLYIKIFVPFGKILGKLLWVVGDMFLIDGLIVNGMANLINFYSRILRKLQSGYVNTYATFMILGIIMLITFATRLIFS